MLDSFMANTGQHINTNPWLALVAVFVGGILTASNPCVLAMIPLMMSFVAGRKEQSVGPLKALGYSLAFVLGRMNAGQFLQTWRRAAPWLVPFMVLSFYVVASLQALRWWLTQRPFAPGLKTPRHRRCGRGSRLTRRCRPSGRWGSFRQATYWRRERMVFT